MEHYREFFSQVKNVAGDWSILKENWDPKQIFFIVMPLYDNSQKQTQRINLSVPWIRGDKENVL